MKSYMKLASSVSMLAFAFTANAMDAPKEDCCDQVAELETRVKRLEDKAVEGSKKLYIYGSMNRMAAFQKNGFNHHLFHSNNANVDSKFGVTGKAAFADGMHAGLTMELGIIGNDSLTSSPTLLENVRTNHMRTSLSNSGSANNINIRKAEAFVDFGYGMVTLGRGNMSSEGVHDSTDLSGTTSAAAGATAASLTAGGMHITDNVIKAKDAHPNSPLHHTILPIAALFDSGDGFVGNARRDRAKLTVGPFFGVSIEAAHAFQNTGHAWDVAFKHDAKYAGIHVKAQAFFSKSGTNETFVGFNADDAIYSPAPGHFSVGTDDYKQFGGSLGMLLPYSMSGKDHTGISLMASFTRRNWKEALFRNGTMLFGKIGYADSFMDMGNTAISFDYGQWNNMMPHFGHQNFSTAGAAAAGAGTPNFNYGAVNSLDPFAVQADLEGSGAGAGVATNGALAVRTRATSWGVVLTQHMEAAGAEVSLFYRNYNYKLRPTAGLARVDNNNVALPLTIAQQGAIAAENITSPVYKSAKIFGVSARVTF